MKADILQEKPDETAPVLTQGHRHLADPMSEEFTALLMECFHEARQEAIARSIKHNSAQPSNTSDKA